MKIDSMPLLRLISELESYVIKHMHKEMDKELRQQKQEGRFGFIPFDRVSLFTLIEASVRLFQKQFGKTPKTFVDIGSGIGTALYIAEAFGLEATGIEIERKYAKMRNGTTIADATKWNHYGNKDIVYCYLPCCKKELARKIFKQMYVHTKPETLFILPFERDWRRALSANDGRYFNWRLKRVSKGLSIYVKQGI